jgi:hypothetical protein
MDPYVATLLKQCAVIAGGFLAVGLLAALAYGLYQYSELRYAMALNLVPPQLS